MESEKLKTRQNEHWRWALLTLVIKVKVAWLEEQVLARDYPLEAEETNGETLGALFQKLKSY